MPMSRVVRTLVGLLTVGLWASSVVVMGGNAAPAQPVTAGATASATGSAPLVERGLARQAGPTPGHGAGGDEFLKTYCLTCHNPRTKAGGLVLEGLEPTAVSSNAATWERVVLSCGPVMPPATARQPHVQDRERFLAELEGTLDREAEKHPNPGRSEPFHRLNRFEYQNAIEICSPSRSTQPSPAGGRRKLRV